MNGREAIQAALEGTRFILNRYVEDFSDADMFVRPVPGANHAAWQIGQVTVADRMIIKDELPDAAYPELPAGFIEAHTTEGAKKDGPGGFLAKADMLELFNAVRSATIAAVGSLSDADLNRSAVGKLAAFAPTLGRTFLLVSNHTLLHAGQFTVIRRKLGKPVLF